jgi:WD40 repeat protein
MGVFSYQNDFIIIGSTSGEVHHVNLETGSKVFSYFHKGKVTGVDINYEDDLIVSASFDGTCLLHKASERKKLRTLEFAEHGQSKNLPFFGCRFSKRGDVLFTVSSDEYSFLTQWDMKELAPIVTFRIHHAPISTFNMSLDGFFLGIGTQDGWVRILNTRTMDFERKSKEFELPVSAFSFTYDSRHVVVASGYEFKNMFNTRGEGFFSKASKIWVISIFLLWFYLYFS